MLFLFLKNHRRLVLTNLLFVSILLLAALIRFYRLPEMASFDYDQESDSNIAYSIIKENPVRLLGQELSFQGMFMGPFYYYYLAFFYKLTNLYPIGGVIGSVLLGMLIIVGYYFLANKLFGAPAGFIAMLMRSILTEELLHDWSMIPSYACEISVIATWWCFYEIWHDRKIWFYMPLLGLIFGLYTSIYPILFPFYFIFIYILIMKKIKLSKSIISVSLFAFLLPISPLLIFEIKYGFIQTQRLLQVISLPRESFNTQRLLYFLKYNFSELIRILNLRFITIYMSAGMLLIYLFFAVRQKFGFWRDAFHMSVLPAAYIIFILSFTFLPTHVSDNYFLALSSLSLLYISGSLALLKKNLILRLVLIMLLFNITITNVYGLTQRWRNPSLASLYHKNRIVREIIKMQGNPKKPFYVSYISLLGWDNGFDYLFKYYGAKPLKGPAKEPVYTIVIPKYLVTASLDKSVGNIGLIFPEEITKGKHPYQALK